MCVLIARKKEHNNNKIIHGLWQWLKRLYCSLTLKLFSSIVIWRYLIVFRTIWNKMNEFWSLLIDSEIPLFCSKSMHTQSSQNLWIFNAFFNVDVYVGLFTQSCAQNFNFIFSATGRSKSTILLVKVTSTTSIIGPHFILVTQSL